MQNLSDTLLSIAKEIAQLKREVERLRVKESLNKSLADTYYLGVSMGVWASYTPIWTASTTNPVLGNGSLIGRYCVVGKLCTMSVKLVIGSTTTLGTGNWAFSIPLPMIAGDATAPVYIGTAHCRNLGVMSYVLAVYLEPNISTTKTAYFVQDNTNSINLTPTVPFAWSTGDILTFEITYELA